MEENQGPEFLRLGPKGMKLWVRQLLAVNAPPDRGAAQPQLLDTFFQLLDCQVGILQRHGGEGDKAIWLDCTHFGQFFILYSNNSSPSLIVTLTPTGCMMPWSKLGGIFQVYMKFLH
jgi:hypothetical protein